MTAVRELLQSKADNTVQAVRPDDSVYVALQRMAEKGIGALLVTDDSGIVGIVTERDYARKIALLGRTSAATQVRDVMTTKVLFVEPGHTTDDCMQLMTAHHLRHLPVVDGDRLVGMVSIGDLVKDTISKQKIIIEQLQNYIAGGVH